MSKERKSEQTKQANGRPVIFQNVQFQPKLHIFPFVNPVFNHEPSEQISLLNFGE
jgi:hypothetical protein